ncbi:hypothetical protein NW067_06870 [Mycoplasmopsis cynos]|nr:hypothetical protein [Mycoplasmopsis cynos]UWV82630.1 hypothetical protein NW067_06870 [Mycoplasmopsis cynos]
MTSIEVAIQQANYIIAQWISQDIEIREEIKKEFCYKVLYILKLKKHYKDEKRKFRNYYDYKIPIKYIKNHNVLAINRAVELEIVSLGFEYKFENFVSFILYKIDRKKINENNFKAPIIDALKRLILFSRKRNI